MTQNDPENPTPPITKIFVAHDDLGYAALVERVADLFSKDAEVTSA